MDESQPRTPFRLVGWLLVVLLCGGVFGLSLWILAGIFQTPVLALALLIAVGLFGVPLFHYVVWGWWLSKRLRDEEENEQ